MATGTKIRVLVLFSCKDLQVMITFPKNWIAIDIQIVLW